MELNWSIEEAPSTKIRHVFTLLNFPLVSFTPYGITGRSNRLSFEVWAGKSFRIMKWDYLTTCKSEWVAQLCLFDSLQCIKYLLGTYVVLSPAIGTAFGIQIKTIWTIQHNVKFKPKLTRIP